MPSPHFIGWCLAFLLSAGCGGQPSTASPPQPPTAGPALTATPEAPAELTLAELERKKIDYQPIALDAVANRALVDDVPGDGRGGWTDQGNNSVIGFPTGRRTFLGVPFLIAAESERQALVLRGKNDASLPARATIPVGKRARAVYFLHASAGGGDRNGAYEVHYEDGVRLVIPLRSNQEIFDFWQPDASAYARTAWRGKNPQRDGIGVTLFAWKNPHPEKQIRAIVATTPGDGAYLGLLGLTLASEGPYLTPAPVIRLDDETWFPFAGVNLAERRGTPLDASGLLDAPAGKHGVLGRQGDGFVFGDGRKVRFWGMSLTDQLNFPSREQAAYVAELCAQLGFNMTRHHLLDAQWSQANVFGSGRSDTQALDPERLDRFDYLVAKLIERGIYVHLDLIAQRKPLAADGVHEPEHVEPGYKLVGQFDEALIANQERFARQLLSHRNPHTGKTYAEDPAVAMVTITNESSLFFLGGAGQGQLRSEYHRKLLKKLYNEWLAKRGDRASLEARWQPGAGEGQRLGLGAGEDPGSGSVLPILDFSDHSRELERYSHARVTDNFTFLYELERAFHARMTKAIRATGFRGLITGTNHWTQQPIAAYVNAATDWVDAHAYYSHPPNGYRYEPGVSFLPEPSVKAVGGLIDDVVRRRVAGLPYSVSEWSSVQPVFRNDALVMMAAYAGLHGFSPLMYSLGDAPFGEAEQTRCKLDNVFVLRCQAGTLALWPALSRLFHRGDVKESPEARYRQIGRQELFDARTRIGLPAGLAYVVKSGMAFVDGEARPPDFQPLLDKYVKGSVATSITGELMTDWSKGLFKFDTPRSQGLAGATLGKKESVSNLSVTVSNPWATVIATSLDDKPIARSRRILISAVGNAVNRGMTLALSGTTWKNGGQAPVLLEPMLGVVELTGLTGDVNDITVFSLAQSGQRASVVPGQLGPGNVRFELRAEHRALHYEVVRAEPQP